MSDYIYHIEDSAGNVQTCMADDHELVGVALVLYVYGPLEYSHVTGYASPRKLVAGYAGWGKFWRTAIEK